MQEVFDELVAWATIDERQAELLDAKEKFFALTGEIFDDDKQFEMRMASFLEHYVCDRVSPLRGKTPASAVTFTWWVTSTRLPGPRQPRSSACEHRSFRRPW